MENFNNRNKKGDSVGVKVFGGILTASLLMFGSASFAQERENVSNEDVNEFSEYDANADQYWDRNEFDVNMKDDRTFDTWDADLDGTISEDEFNEANQSQPENEAQQAMEEAEPTNENEGTAIEQDGTIEPVSNTDIGEFNDWDTNQDGTINRDEYNEGIYNNWDANQDGILDETEYNDGLNSFESDVDAVEGEGNESETGLDEDSKINNDLETETETGTQINEGTESETEINEGTGNELE